MNAHQKVANTIPSIPSSGVFQKTDSAPAKILKNILEGIKMDNWGNVENQISVT